MSWRSCVEFSVLTLWEIRIPNGLTDAILVDKSTWREGSFFRIFTSNRQKEQDIASHWQNDTFVINSIFFDQINAPSRGNRGKGTRSYLCPPPLARAAKARFRQKMVRFSSLTVDQAGRKSTSWYPYLSAYLTFLLLGSFRRWSDLQLSMIRKTFSFPIHPPTCGGPIWQKRRTKNGQAHKKLRWVS